MRSIIVHLTVIILFVAECCWACYSAPGETGNLLYDGPCDDSIRTRLREYNVPAAYYDSVPGKDEQTIHLQPSNMAKPHYEQPIDARIEKTLKNAEPKLNDLYSGSTDDRVGSEQPLPTQSLPPPTFATPKNILADLFSRPPKLGRLTPDGSTLPKFLPKLPPMKLFGQYPPYKFQGFPSLMPPPIVPNKAIDAPASPPRANKPEIPPAAISPSDVAPTTAPTPAKAEAGPVVQPTNLIQKGDVIPKHLVHAPTIQQLEDAKKIRDEIIYAVEHNQHVPLRGEIVHHHHHHHHLPPGTIPQIQSLVPPSPPIQSLVPPSPPIQSWIPPSPPFMLGSQHDDAVNEDQSLPEPQSLSTTEATMIETDRLNDQVVDRMISQKGESNSGESKNIHVNVVESHALDNVEHEQTFVNSDLREVLHIKAITEDMKFKSARTVFAWKTIQRNVRDKHALVGLTATSVLLLVEQNGTYVQQAEVPILSRPSCMTSYTRWNRTQQSIEGIVIVSTQNELVFIRVNEEFDAMQLYWMVPLSKASAIEYFTINEAHLIALVSSDENHPMANVYRFELDFRQLYLRESLALAGPANTLAYLTTGSEHFLMLPQRKSAIVFKYAQNRFKYFVEIGAENIETLNAFEMGGNAYLALGGTRPRILRYYRGQFHDQTVLAPSWGIVEHFLPIPARTYRDDMILLVQHRIAFSTHNISVLEALIWNGEAFDPALAIPCIINERKSEHGLACMLDHDRDAGIEGATVFQRNGFITSLVPRHDAPSGLFDLEFELMPSEYDYDEATVDLFAEILAMLEHRKREIDVARQTLNDYEMSRDEEVTVTDRVFDIIVTNYVEWNGELASDTQLFYGNESTSAQVMGDVIRMVNATPSTVPSDASRAKRDDNERNVVRLQSLTVSNLFVETINNISVDGFVFLQNNKMLDLDGTLELRQSLDFDEVQRRNDEPQPSSDVHSIDTMRDDADGMQENVAEQRMDIAGDISFAEINGIPWQQLIDEIVWKNRPQNLSELIVLGELIAEGELNVGSLNELAFPSSFLLNDGSRENVITGRKTFTGDLMTSDVDCTDTINGIDPDSIITLSGDGIISGNTTFHHLEVTGALDVNPKGQISGRHLNKFLANPTLFDTKYITASCDMKSIEVQGSVYIQGNVIDQRQPIEFQVDDVLSDVVYKHEPETTCTSFKTFQSISAPNIELTSNLVDGIQLKDFVTSDTDQTFNVSELHGIFHFVRLSVDGLFNNINVTELDENSVKLLGEQYTGIELVFDESLGSFAIDANALQITTAINEVPVAEFIGLEENVEFFEDITLNSIDVNECFIGQEISSGDDYGQINGHNVRSLEKTYMSRSREQQMPESFHVQTAIIRGAFDANFLNNYDFRDALTILKNRKTNDALLREKQIKVGRLAINGDLRTQRVNGFDLENIAARAIWLNRFNEVGVPLTFSGQLDVRGNLITTVLNYIDFNGFVEDLVYKSNEQLHIMGTTVFRSGLRVLYDIDASYVNDYRIDGLLHKRYNAPITNPLHIYGDVHVSDLVVNGTLAGIHAEHIHQNYHFDGKLGMHVISKNAHFGDKVRIGYLELDGGINDVPNANAHLKTVVRKGQPSQINGVKTFVGSVNFENDIHILDYNGIAVDAFLRDILLVDQDAPINVARAVTFIGEVDLMRLNVNGALRVNTIAGCSIDEWYANAIRTDFPYQFSRPVIFHANAIEVANIDLMYLNDRPTQHILTLNTEQRFDQRITFTGVGAKISSNDNFKWLADMKNTFMIGSDQVVTLSTHFSALRVLKRFETGDSVNDKDLRAPISLSQDIRLYGPMSFSVISVNNLYTTDLVSSIDFDHWVSQSLRSWAQQPQIVSGYWTVRDAKIGSILSDSGINGIDAATYITTIDAANQKLYRNYQESCNNVQQLIDTSQKNVIVLDHFNVTFKLAHVAPIDSIYLFKVNRQSYLLTNAGCWTIMHYWNYNTQKYEVASSVYTGIVNEWLHVMDALNVLHLVSNSQRSSAETGCSISGANIWQYESGRRAFTVTATFGNAGDYRSIQTNGRTHFYALRRRDNRVVEFNLNGAPVTEWMVDQTQQRENGWNFLPSTANLGLAISNGQTISLLSSELPKVRPVPIRTNNSTQPVIASIQKSFDDYNAAKAILLNDESINAKINPVTLKKMHELISEIDEWIIPQMHEFENELKRTAATSAPESDGQSGVDARLSEMIVSQLDAVSHFVVDADNGGCSPQTGCSKHTNDGDVGDTFGDILDKLTPTADLLFDKLIDKLHAKKTEAHSWPELGMSHSLDDTTIVGDKFGDLLDMLTPVADNVFDKLVDYIHKKESSQVMDDAFAENMFHYMRSEIEKKMSNGQRYIGTQGNVGGAFSGTSDDPTQIAELLFEKLIAKIRKKKERPSSPEEIAHIDNSDGRENRFVGDAFGSLLDKFTPAADVIFDKLVEKIRWKSRKAEAKTLPEDAMLGDKFGDLLNKLTPVADNVFDKLADYIRKKEGAEPHYESYDVQRASDSSRNDAADDVFIGNLFSYLQGQIKTQIEKDRVSNERNPNVGDKFGDIMNNLTPMADVLFDKIIEKIRHKHIERPLASDEYIETAHSIATMSDVAQRVQSQQPRHHNLFEKYDPDANDMFARRPETSLDEHKTAYQIGQAIREMVHSPTKENPYHTPLRHHSLHHHKVHSHTKHRPMHTHHHEHESPKHIKPSHGKHIHHSVDSHRPHHSHLGSTHDNDEQLDAEPVLGSFFSNQTFGKYADTLMRYAGIAKSVYDTGKELYHEFKGVVDDNYSTTDEYAAPEARQKPNPQHSTSHDASHSAHQSTHMPAKTKAPSTHTSHHSGRGSKESRPIADGAMIDATRTDRQVLSPHDNKDPFEAHANADDVLLGSAQSNDHDAHLNDNLDLHLDENFIVGDAKASSASNDFTLGSRVVHAVRKYIGRVYKKGKQFITGRRKSTEQTNAKKSWKYSTPKSNGMRKDPKLGSVHEITENHESDSEAITATLHSFHNDTEDLLEELEALHVKYENLTKHDDGTERQFKSDVHNVFFRLDRLIAKHEQNVNELDQSSRIENIPMKRIGMKLLTMPSPAEQPQQSHKEIVALTVGPERKALVVVSTQGPHAINGSNNDIQIYEDVIDGNLYQTIACRNPKHLTTFHSESETVLAFIDDGIDVRVFIYRGIQRFVEFTSFRLPAPATAMAHNRIVDASTIACPQNYLTIVVINELWFLQAVTIGNCKIVDKLKC